VSRRFDCADARQRARGLAEAADAVRRSELVVLPTDTVYGIGADAFSAQGVEDLLAAKGRGRDMPVPVLVGSPGTLWPGALTIVAQHQPSLQWDLGDARGTVAVRMPLHPVAIELLTETGPMAVSSANRTGEKPATTVDEALGQLGESVAVYLDGGPCGDPVPSSIVDLTGEKPRLLREGAISLEELRTVVPDVEGPG